MSFGYNTFKAEISKHFVVNFVPKKNMLAKTEAPPMRVASVRISMPIDSIDDAIRQAVPMALS
jgi:hypothetical protein